jgi:predicted metal-binding membrane protein
LPEAALDALLRRDKLVAGAALATLVVAAWLYLLHLSTGMADMSMPGMAMPGMDMPMMHPWTMVEVATLVVMWTVMMVAMMIPSAAPMILLFSTVHRRRAAAGRPAVPTALFVLGYLAVWAVFSIAAALGQSALHAAALLSPAMAMASPMLAGAVLTAAGVVQWTPLKRACLAACRSPLSFLMSGWREGHRGALLMGVRHGVYCLGCCWAVMALLFVAGVMNLVWVAAIAIGVLVEKVAPWGDVAGRIAGVALMAAGVLVAARGLAT